MFFNNTKRREFTEETAPEKKKLKLKVEISLDRLEQYGSEKTVVELVHTEVLNSDSDTRIKEIKTEVEGKLHELYDKTMEKVDLSDLLSDGFHAEKDRQKASLQE